MASSGVAATSVTSVTSVVVVPSWFERAVNVHITAPLKTVVGSAKNKLKTLLERVNFRISQGKTMLDGDDKQLVSDFVDGLSKAQVSAFGPLAKMCELMADTKLRGKSFGQLEMNNTSKTLSSNIMTPSESVNDGTIGLLMGCTLDAIKTQLATNFTTALENDIPASQQLAVSLIVKIFKQQCGYLCQSITLDKLTLEATTAVSEAREKFNPLMRHCKHEKLSGEPENSVVSVSCANMKCKFGHIEPKGEQQKYIGTRFKVARKMVPLFLQNPK